MSKTRLSKLQKWILQQKGIDGLIPTEIIISDYFGKRTNAAEVSVSRSLRKLREQNLVHAYTVRKIRSQKIAKLKSPIEFFKMKNRPKLDIATIKGMKTKPEERTIEFMDKFNSELNELEKMNGKNASMISLAYFKHESIVAVEITGKGKSLMLSNPYLSKLNNKTSPTT